MNVQELLAGGGGLLLVLTLVQIAPIKVNPWTIIGKAILKGFSLLGKAFNAELYRELAEIKAKIENHVVMDDRRTADGHRTRILHFNNELLRDIPHTREEFFEVLNEIKAYEDYCDEHPEYPNNRAVMAIENIRECYKERQHRRDFLPDVIAPKTECSDR